MAALRTALTLIAAGAVILLVGCGQKATQDPAALEGVQWTLSSSSEVDAELAKLGILAEFRGGRMTGFSGVNTYNGPYKAGEDGTFKGGPFASTMMAGPAPAMAAEAAYLKIVQAAVKYEVTDGRLTLTTDGGDSVTYEAAKPFELAGSSWTVTGYNNGKEAVVSVVADSELTLQFGTDKTVSGSGGVNTFNGPFEAAETSIAIGPLMTTKMAGPEELMTQEQQYLTALQAATQWEVARGVLTLRDANGAMQVTAATK